MIARNDLAVRQIWKDDRLAYGNFTNKQLSRSFCVDSKIIDQIWLPDLFFVDAKSSKRHTVIRDNSFVDVRIELK